MSDTPVANLKALMTKIMGTVAKSDDIKILSRDLTQNIDGLGKHINGMSHNITGVRDRVHQVEIDIRIWEAGIEKQLGNLKT